MRDPIHDPFSSLQRTKTDQTGVRLINRSKVTPGLVVFHTIVGNKILAVDENGEIRARFETPPGGYQYYRPGKAGTSRSIYCILKSKSKFEDRTIGEVDETGNFLWHTSHHHFTHDYQVRGNTIITVLRREGKIAGKTISDNVLCEMSKSGKIRWEWSLAENLTQLTIADQVATTVSQYNFDNPFHVNSVDLCDWPIVMKQFGEPIILASARNMNSVFCVGRWSGEVRFEYSSETLGQHHARILPDFDIYRKSQGRLLIVDNGCNFIPPNLFKSRGYSRIIELDMQTKHVHWEYSGADVGKHFFSPIVGAQQRLSTGNTLITEGYYGRIFEVTPNGETVWDYVCPETNDLSIHLATKKLHETGLRQIYRAYKVSSTWLDGSEKLH